MQSKAGKKERKKERKKELIRFHKLVPFVLNAIKNILMEEAQKAGR